MAIARTARGTASDKTSSLTLDIPGVQVARRLLPAGITYNDTHGPPEATWGNHKLDLIEEISANGIVTALYAYRRRRGAKTRTLQFGWQGTAPVAKAAWCSTYSEVGTLDLVSSASQIATTSPNAGASQTSNFADEVFIGVMGAEGPGNDAVGSPSNGYTLDEDQRAFTNGAPPPSNVTCHEIFKIVTATESTQAEITGAVSRDWCSVLTTWVDTRENDFNNTQYDQDEIQDRAEIDDLNERDYFIKPNDLLGQNEMIHIDSSGVRTLKMTWKPDTAGWVAV